MVNNRLGVDGFDGFDGKEICRRQLFSSANSLG